MRRRVGVEENDWCSVDGMFLGEVQGEAGRHHECDCALFCSVFTGVAQSHQSTAGSPLPMKTEH